MLVFIFKKTSIKVFGLLLALPIGLFAQFDGIVGSEGCKAIHCDDNQFISWATSCQVVRGYKNITSPASGHVTFGEEINAIGKATVNNATQAISLGDGGEAVLSFQMPIANGEGYDFAVFENSFDDYFLELAFVEVSSDGVNYFRFPATSNTQTAVQTGSYDTTYANLINNLAGKYKIGWGTPFDLDELPDTSALDKNNILYVKIIDVVGSINPQYATFDAHGNIINDPYPTAFASGGFDLTGVGVLHTTNSLQNINERQAYIYPNPCNNVVYINADNCQMTIYNSLGQLMDMQKVIGSTQINTESYPKGIYFIYFQNEQTKKCIKLIKQ